MVWHPKPYWIDPATGDRVRPPASDSDRARLHRRVSFGIGYVFDLSATDGEPLPELGRPPPTTRHGSWRTTSTATAAITPSPSTSVNCLTACRTYYQREGDRIVDAASSPGARLGTLAHELAHREDPELVAAHVAGDRAYYTHNRPDCEAVAEAAAHTISARFGHDITGHSAGYSAGWIRGDVDRFKQLHERVGQLARQLVPPDQLDQILDAARTQANVNSSRRSASAGRSR